MKKILMTLILCLSSMASAETVYVGDRLYLGVTETPGSSQSFVTLKNGTKMQSLAVDGKYTQVKLEDGREGWVRTLFISKKRPASLIVSSFEKDTAALEEKIAQLEATIKEKDAQQISPQEMFNIKQEQMVLETQLKEAKNSNISYLLMGLAASLLTLVLGYFIGYQVLSKRIKEKFHGMKVW